MSRFLDQYLKRSFSNIVFESTKENELGNAYSRELTWETVVAKKGTKFFRIVVRESTSFAPHASGVSSGIDSETEITAGEYNRIAKGKPILDGAAVRQALKDREKATDAEYERQEKLRQMRAPLIEQLEQMAPKCKNCGKQMVRKTRNGSQFWACRFFPRDCDGDVLYLSREAMLIALQLDEIG
jgi:hypothetical protein